MKTLSILPRVAAMALLVSACPSFGAERSQVQPLSIEESVAIRGFHDGIDEGAPVSLSPDGRWLAIAAHDPGKILRNTSLFASREVTLTVYDLQTGKRFELGRPDTHNVYPLWSPDSRSLAYISNRDRDDAGEYRLRIWDTRTGEDRLVSSAVLLAMHPDNGNNYAWMPDSRHIVARFAHNGVTGRLFEPGKRLFPPAPPTPGGTPSPATPARVAAKLADVFVYPPPAEPTDTGVSARTRSQMIADVRKYVYLGKIDIASGEVSTLVERVDVRPGNFIVSPDGRYLSYEAIAYGDIDSGTAKFEDFKFDQYVVPTGGGASRRIEEAIRTQDGTQWRRWSPDSRFQLYSSGGRGQVLADEGAFIVSVDDAQRRKLSPGLFADAQWAPDGKSVLLVGDPAPRPVSIPAAQRNANSQENGRDIPGLWRYDLATGLMKRLTPEGWAWRVRSLQLAPDRNAYYSPDQGRSALFLARDPKTLRDSFWKVDTTTGALVKLDEAEKLYTMAGISADGKRFAFAAEDGQHPPDIWMTDAGFRTPPKRVSALNPQLEGRALGSSRLVSYTSRRGETLPMGLVLPADYQPGKRYPLVIIAYPGFDPYSGKLTEVRKFQASASWPSAQLFATRGYAVMYLSPPQRYGTPMKDIADAISPAIDKAIAMGIADPDRIGIYGHSYGGYTVLSMIVQDPRLAAAVESAGPSSIISSSMNMNPQGDGAMGRLWARGQGKMTGSYWERRDEYYANSPLYQLDKVRTPLLILHGQRDATVPSTEADAVYAGLKSLGKSVEYRRYLSSAHIYEPDDWADATAAMLRWFDTYLKQETAPNK